MSFGFPPDEDFEFPDDLEEDELWRDPLFDDGLDFDDDADHYPFEEGEEFF